MSQDERYSQVTLPDGDIPLGIVGPDAGTKEGVLVYVPNLADRKFRIRPFAGGGAVRLSMKKTAELYNSGAVDWKDGTGEEFKGYCEQEGISLDQDEPQASAARASGAKKAPAAQQVSADIAFGTVGAEAATVLGAWAKEGTFAYAPNRADRKFVIRPSVGSASYLTKKRTATLAESGYVTFADGGYDEFLRYADEDSIPLSTPAASVAADDSKPVMPDGRDAVVTEEAAVPMDDIDRDASPADQPIRDMSLGQLRKLAADAGVPDRANMGKEELVAVLTAWGYGAAYDNLGSEPAEAAFDGNDDTADSHEAANDPSRQMESDANSEPDDAIFSHGDSDGFASTEDAEGGDASKTESESSPWDTPMGIAGGVAKKFMPDGDSGLLFNLGNSPEESDGQPEPEDDQIVEVAEDEPVDPFQSFDFGTPSSPVPDEPASGASSDFSNGDSPFASFDFDVDSRITEDSADSQEPVDPFSAYDGGTAGSDIPDTSANVPSSDAFSVSDETKRDGNTGSSDPFATYDNDRESFSDPFATYDTDQDSANFDYSFEKAAENDSVAVAENPDNEFVSFADAPVDEKSQAADAFDFGTIEIESPEKSFVFDSEDEVNENLDSKDAGQTVDPFAGYAELDKASNGNFDDDEYDAAVATYVQSVSEEDSATGPVTSEEKSDDAVEIPGWPASDRDLAKGDSQWTSLEFDVDDTSNVADLPANERFDAAVEEAEKVVLDSPFAADDGDAVLVVDDSEPTSNTEASEEIAWPEFGNGPQGTFATREAMFPEYDMSPADDIAMDSDGKDDAQAPSDEAIEPSEYVSETAVDDAAATVTFGPTFAEMGHASVGDSSTTDEQVEEENSETSLVDTTPLDRNQVVGAAVAAAGGIAAGVAASKIAGGENAEYQGEDAVHIDLMDDEPSTRQQQPLRGVTPEDRKDIRGTYVKTLILIIVLLAIAGAVVAYIMHG